VSEE
jgi:hypothetical protein